MYYDFATYVIPDDKIVGEIQKGLLLLLGIDRYDTKYEHAFPCSIACRESIEKMIQKTLKVCLSRLSLIMS